MPKKLNTQNVIQKSLCFMMYTEIQILCMIVDVVVRVVFEMCTFHYVLQICNTHLSININMGRLC